MNATAAKKEVVKKAPVKPKMTVAEYLNAQIDLCGKSQADIAAEMGLEKPNVITMFKQGKSKLPLSRVGAMAKALNIDPTFLFQLVMSEYEPDTWAAIQGDILKQPYVSQNELEIIQLVRQCNVPNPKVRTLEEKERLLSAFNRLRPDNAVSGD
jgi:transcriptional regulator with XRE-family HTH domain